MAQAIRTRAMMAKEKGALVGRSATTIHVRRLATPSRGAPPMAGVRPDHLLRQVRQLVAAQAAHGLPDRALLEGFVRARDEAAFAALVERHGAMVLSVCRRVLRHTLDAEDACQAAFLVLARRASAIRRRDSLASWLHGVAYRVASDLRRSLIRRREREGPAADRAEPDAAADVSWREVRAALDEELTRLPERYRAPLVLCYLEGRTRDEAAGQLGWSAGALHGRLERGRQLLRGRLVRRGLTLSAGLLGTALAEGAPAAMPASLAVATTRAAALVASGGSAASVISTQVTLLAQGVLKAMFLTKIKIATAVLAGAVLVSAGAGGVSHRLFAAGRPGADSQAELPAAQVDEQKAVTEKQDRLKELELQNQKLQEENKKLEEAEMQLQRVELKMASVLKKFRELADRLEKELAVNESLRKEMQGKERELNELLRKELQRKSGAPEPSTVLEQAREEVELREAQLEVQQAVLEGVATQLPGAKRHLERVLQLANTAVISSEEVNKARSQVENLEAQYKVKKAETKVAEVQLKHAKQRLARLEEKKPTP
jgi:RNA polymerase sigma factor (sigma-70 family)